MHADFQHIFFNMFAVWMFGRVLEQVWGPKRFLTYYLVCGIGAGLMQELVQYVEYETVISNYQAVDTGMGIVAVETFINSWNTVGASGAVFGILLAFGMLFPNSEMLVFPIPMPIKAKYFVIGYAVLEFFLGVAGGGNVAHFAHLGGSNVVRLLYDNLLEKEKWRWTKFIADLKANFQRGDIVTKLVYINAGVFLLISLVGIVLTLFNVPPTPWVNYLELPAWVLVLVRQPWSLFTYMFMHANLLHILFNMLWLFWFGRIFLSFFSAKHLRGLYILGGICGGLMYILSYNVFPYFEDAIYSSYLLGASASVLAIVMATAVREPESPVQFMFIGTVRLKYVALFMVALDLLFMTSGNAGGHIAHLGGALAGWWFRRTGKRT